MLIEMQKIFVQYNQSTYANIMEALKAGDDRKAHRIIHTLKSNAGQIQEKQLQEAAKIAEEALAKTPPEPIGEHLEIIKTELDRILSELAHLYQKETKKSAKKAIGKKETAQLLSRLDYLLKSRDTRCFDYLSELSSIPKTDELIELIENYQFKEARIILEELKKEYE
ncbi:MAG: Hpt domain-containing protein [Oscillospiraceae bacterium]|nr:Hpt domain-containing protein [Oscillospiraceae bacterium]